MTITEIFEELDTVYNEEWFNDAQYKFNTHPSNEGNKDTFSITIRDYEIEYKSYSKIITIDDFVLGARDDAFDDLQIDSQESKFEDDGELPNGERNRKLIQGEQYISSYEFYPELLLIHWRKKIILKINKDLSLIMSLAEKDAYFDVLDEVIEIYKTAFITIGNIRNKVLINSLNFVIEYILQTKIETKEIHTFIKNKPIESKIRLNLNQEKLSKLIYLLIRNGIFDSEDQQIITFFSNHFLVKKVSLKNTEYTSLNSLRNAFQKTMSTYYDDIKWLNENKLNL